MERLDQKNKCETYLNTLCVQIRERSVGSAGNREATDFFKDELAEIGWQTELQEFEAMDWIDGGATLQVAGKYLKVYVSPYSLGCNAEAALVLASTIQELEEVDCAGKILLLSGEIAKEQLMPKGFVFYNPEEHQQIIRLLEEKKPKAIISATGRNAALAGGVYPFPLIEDGDFNIPSVYMTEEEGKRLLNYTGHSVSLKSDSQRIPGNGFNVIGRKGKRSKQRIVVTAHIDAKKGTPGAIDNASGVVILLLLAHLLRDYKCEREIELVAFNGEDYYAVPGQMLYIEQKQGQFEDIILNINIDGAGYLEGKSAFSFYGLEEEMETSIRQIIDESENIEMGKQWVQGDHSIFIQFGCPAMAVSSKWFTDNIEEQDITHTPKDNISIVNCDRLIEIADALARIIILPGVTNGTI